MAGRSTFLGSVGWNLFLLSGEVVWGRALLTFSPWFLRPIHVCFKNIGLAVES